MGFRPPRIMKSWITGGASIRRGTRASCPHQPASCRRAGAGVGLHSARAQASGRMPKAAGWKPALPFRYTRMGIFGVVCEKRPAAFSRHAPCLVPRYTGVKTHAALLLAIAAPAVLAAPLPASAGEYARAESCQTLLKRRSWDGKQALWYATFPFRALGWAMYHTIRAPGQLSEHLVFGQTGEEVASPVAVAPAPPWKRDL